MLTTKEAWTKIAEAFERFASGGRRGELVRYGLCHALSELEGRNEIDWSQFANMSSEVEGAFYDADDTEWATYEAGDYLWETNRPGAALRAILATIYAEASD